MRLPLTGCYIIAMLLTACSTGGLGTSANSPDAQVYAPGVDAKGEAVDGLVVGHRLMQAGQNELALEAFSRAAGEQGLTPEILVAMGSANLGLGRLNQSEVLLRRAVKERGDWPEAWNNLGVLLMEKGQTAEASEIFRKAYALDNGESDAIRDNLRLALAKLENPVYDTDLDQDYQIVRQNVGSYLIKTGQ